VQKYIFSPDKHVGWERGNKKLVPIHDSRSIKALMKFAQDFKPDIWIEGGDNLDCGPVSHWLQDKKLSLSNLDLSRDTDEYTKLVLDPLKQVKSIKRRYWMIGNHEMWLSQLAEKHPGIQNVLSVDNLLDLSNWQIIGQGGHVKLGKLYFIHGDTLPSGTQMAHQAVVRYEHSIRFGHFHTSQSATKYSALSAKDVKTGVAVPGLCRRNPNYLLNKPNQWSQGFNWGYIHADGTFTDYTTIIVNNRFTALGRTYRA
jgi:hypothetical protein